MSSTTETVASRDGTAIVVRQWPAPDQPWAHVLLVHGIHEHSGRYEHVGDWLTAAGIDVTSYDQRGFGRSGGRRAYVDRWSQNNDDLEERLAAVRVAAGDGPVVLYGHSLGGLLSLGYVVADPPRPLPDVLILSAPAIEIDDAGLAARARVRTQRRRPPLRAQERLRRFSAVTRSGGR